VRPLPFHPLLLGVFPVLFLWAENANEAVPSEVLPVAATVLAATLAVTALLALALRDLRRGGLVASVAALVALSYGRVLGGVPPRPGFAVALAVVLAAGWVAWRLPPERLASVTSTANLGAVILVVAVLVPVVAAGGLSLGGDDGAGPRPDAVAAAEAGLTVPDNPPDIFYIVPDRYPRRDTLTEVFDHDNTAFLTALEQRGFDVLSQSLANYPKTAHSLAASLNLDYLDGLEATVPDADQDNWGPVYALLRDHELGPLLTSAGYEYTHLGTWWSPTATATTADVTLNFDQATEFERVFTGTTIWPAAQALADGEEQPRDQRVWKRDHTAWQFDQLERLARQDPERPRFVLAHLTIPHEPYVFDRDGSFVTLAEERARTREDNLTRQVEYANQRLLGFLDALLADAGPDEGPIVVLQSDEGPHPAPRVAQGPSFSWTGADDAVVAEKLRILNALRLPGVGEGALPETATPVNTFRYILSHYLGADLPPLPDEAYVFPDESELYRFTDVTRRMRAF
jgi:hypothetical protein